MLREVSSYITFLYFQDLALAQEFFENTLGLKAVYDPGWAVVYRLGAASFLGAVDAARGSVPAQPGRGVLISFTVQNVAAMHKRFTKLGLKVSEIKEFRDIALKSFFLEGPEGYAFEMQEFTVPELKKIF
ncbi:MAG: VOC family protein [Firmicutes bacterium]|nr:VOC family protein [Bacillota bacterium]